MYAARKAEPEAMRRTLRIAKGYFLITRGRMKMALGHDLRALADFIRAAHDPGSGAAKVIRCLRWGASLAFIGLLVRWGWTNRAVGRVLPFAVGGFITGR